MMTRGLNYLERLPRTACILISLLSVILIGVIYYWTGSQLAFSIFFLIPICFVTWTVGFPAGIIFSLLSIATWLAADVYDGQSKIHPLWLAINELLRLVLFIAVAWVLAALKQLLEVHKTAARIDELTGIPNRRAFYEAAQMEIARSNRNPRPFTVVYTDIDNFKSVNDRFGHLEGDRLLSLTAEIMRQSVREIDQVARIGGDEFVLLLSDTDARGATAVMERLRNDLTAMAQKHNWPITYSAGAVTFSRPPESVDEMITKADTLMYSVKQSGKDHIRLAND
jgi:diguanylate cyclase (GGDEF)-like protein